MRIIYSITFSLILFFNVTVFAQNNQTKETVPDISYNSPKKYKIADIKVTGIKNYDDFVLIGFSGLSVGTVSFV